METAGPEVYTVGHSTRTIDDFTALLDAYGIEQVVDVRRFPGSRHQPQFGREELCAHLQRMGITYRYAAGLGGRRSVRKDSVNTGWRNAGFRGYADHMQTEEFHTALAELFETARTAPTAIMCAEAVPWRCHRSMIGDALLVRGFDVVDIFDAGKSQRERLTSFAEVVDDRITYPEPL